jgi:hypothetical protein
MPLLDLRHDVAALFGARTGEAVIHRLGVFGRFLPGSCAYSSANSSSDRMAPNSRTSLA